MSFEHIYVCEVCNGYPHDLQPQAYDNIPECTCPEDWPKAEPSAKVEAFVDALDLAQGIYLRGAK